MTQSTVIDNVQIDTTNSNKFIFQFEDGEFISTNESLDVLDWSHFSIKGGNQRFKAIAKFFKKYKNDN